MVTDEEPRAAAEELRARHNCRGFERCDECQALSVRLFGDKFVLCQLDNCDTQYWEALADLIDRPTCAIINSAKLYTAFGELIATMNVYMLSCGHQAVGFEKPGYCPRCGAEVRR